MTPPTPSDPALVLIHDRITQIDSRVCELRASVLTKDSYVNRRNREDEYIRREFESHRSIANRVDANVAVLRTDVDQMKLGVSQLQVNISQLGTETGFLRDDVDRLQQNVKQVQSDLDHLQTDVCGCRVEISKLQTALCHIRTDLMNLQHETSRHQNAILNRFSIMEARMGQMEKVRFNSLAHTIHAPITPVPVIDKDGSLQYPKYFPTNVWRFWCLKKRSRNHRLVELAEFYDLSGYQYWGRMHQQAPYSDDSDSSEASDSPSDLSRADAVYQFPEACHQALAATLGLVYYKIRKEIGEGPDSHLMARPPKRLPEEMASNSSGSKMKPAKIARANHMASPRALHRLVTGPSLASRSVVSEEVDRLGWNVHASSEISEETKTKLKGIISSDVNSLLLALERGLVRLKPSRSEQMNQSPTTESKQAHRFDHPEDGFLDDDARSPPHTIATEIISPLYPKDELRASEANSPIT